MIDNEYICSINNTLYYNFNKIRSTTKDNRGIGLIDSNFFKVKNLEGSTKNYGSLLINKDFKYEVFMTLNKLKNLYKNCETVKNTLSYYATIEDYNNNYLNFKEDNKNIIKNIRFKNTKLYFNDTSLGINSLEIDDADILFINNIDNISFQIGHINTNPIDNYNYTYITKDNMNLYKNTSSLTSDDNNINLSITYIPNYKYFSTEMVTNFVETSSSVWESQTHTIVNSSMKTNIVKFPINISYYIHIPSDIDKNIFKNSGLNIKYNGAPYLTSFNTYDYITIQTPHELNIRTLNSKVFGHNYSNKSCIRRTFNIDTSKECYYILSSKNLFETSNIDFVKSKKILDGANIYLKGTARDEIQEITETIPCEIRINGSDNLIKNLYYRGLNFVAIDKETLEIIDQGTYDTYGEKVNDPNKLNEGITLLKGKLNSINDDRLICLVSYDAIGWDSSLISLLQGFGMGDLPYIDTGRHPFLFMGCKDLGKGNGFTKIGKIGSWRDVVELSTNGDFGPQLIQNKSTKIYLKGTAYDNEHGHNSDVRRCIIQINDGDNLVINPTRRSLNLVTIDKQTHEVIDKEIYDTYGEASGELERYDNGITLLKQKLNDIKNNVARYNDKEVFVCLVSYDGIGWDDELIGLLQEFGMGDLPYTKNWRYPFLFMGYKGLGKGNGFTKMNDVGPAPNEVELTTYISNNIDGKIQITSPNYFQINGLSDYNCYACKIHLNKYLFNELYSLNVITKKSDLHYYQIAPLYIEKSSGELIDNIYNQNKKYVPILNNYPTKYLNDKFFNSKIYLSDNYPSSDELNTCISEINNFDPSYRNNKLYLYEIYQDNGEYYLIFYTILHGNSNDNITEDDIINIGATFQDSLIPISNRFKSLYNNQLSGSLQNSNQLYQYISQYLNNFISF
jgi:hypothetical protein